MYYKLVALESTEQVGRSSWTLHLPSTIGRIPEHEVSINHESISRTHCRLSLNGDGALTVRDLDSMNGTYVADKKITVSVLHPGDILQVGAISFRVEYDSDFGVHEDNLQTFDLSTTVPMKLKTRPDSSRPPVKWWRFW